MIAPMAKRKPSAKRVRYTMTPVEKLGNWARTLRVLADQFGDLAQSAEQNDIEEFKCDGGNGFSEDIEKIKRLIASAAGGIQKEMLDKEM